MNGASDKSESVVLKSGLAQMLKGGVIMDVVSAEQAVIAQDAVNGYLFQLAKLGIWNSNLSGLWENSPVQANDLTEASWK